MENDVTSMANGSSRWQLRSLCVALLVLLRSVPGYRSGGCPGCLTAACMDQLSANSTRRLVRSFLLALLLLSGHTSAASWYGLITWSRSGADERMHM